MILHGRESSGHIKFLYRSIPRKELVAGVIAYVIVYSGCFLLSVARNSRVGLVVYNEDYMLFDVILPWENAYFCN